jgi:exodeoxyribonuclease VII small subunit
VSKKTPSFEQSLETLEKLVHTLEKGDLSLEDALKQFEAGVGLIRSCEEALTTAEQRISTLVEEAE